MAALPLPDCIKKQTSSLKTVESFPVRQFFDSFKDSLELELVAGEAGLQNRKIREKSINRPALALTGYYSYFAHKRLQLFGAGEMGYLRQLMPERQKTVLADIVARNIPCMVVSRGLRPTAEMLQMANNANVPLFRTRMKSKDFTAEATILLAHELAPYLTLHGTLMDIKGVGTLLRGKSGVGKSECALALVERGHSLVADDFVKIRLIGDHELMGMGSELSRGYMECRGIGIINVAELFGVRSVRLRKVIDLVITFIDWHPGMHEERTGLECHYFEILGHPVPHVEIPVRPGRDMARLVEVAALVHALKGMGHDSAHTFNERLIAYMQQNAK